MPVKCDTCNQSATVHGSVIISGTKQEVHLCRKCAEMRQLISSADKPNLPMVVKKFVGNVGFMTAELAKLRCPDCGIKYMDFRKTGRLGCPYDYIFFRNGLLPLLDRVHRARHHRGKRPRHLDRSVESGGEIRSLRHRLRVAVDAEDYEEAARLRDRIRAKEREDGS